jgi:AcrR family transcriptional regulator
VNRLDRRKRDVRERILGAAYDLFLEKGVESTTIEDICERADVANRTFFNHFPVRRDMLRSLAEGQLANSFDVVIATTEQSLSARLVGAFDDIAAALVESGDAHREMIGELAAVVGYAVGPGAGFHDTVLEVINEGITQGEVSFHHDARTLTDIVVAAISGAVVDWARDRTDSLETNLHELGITLADLLTAGGKSARR